MAAPQEPKEKIQQKHSFASANSVIPGAIALQDHEFRQISQLIYDIAGISMAPSKKPLVSSRLSKRLRDGGHRSFADYVRFISAKANAAELQVAVDLLTTNETHFFREIKHFDFLRQQVLPARVPGRPLRIWSAACSSGEEPYSIALLLADVLQTSPWEVVGSDISTRVLEKARSGIYPLSRSKDIPESLLKQYCLKGTGKYADAFMIDKKLRSQVQFVHLNLNKTLPKLGLFDVIFLRNVMIYFDPDTKRQVVQRMLPLLRPGGYFLVGHSETLGGICDSLSAVAPSIYRKPD